LIKCVLCNQKGGAGKSTLAIALASYWHLNGKKVAVVDADPQGSLVLFADKLEASKNLSGLDIYKINNTKDLDDINNLDVDLCIIDTPGRSDISVLAAIDRADIVIIPTGPCELDIDASVKTFEQCLAAGKSVYYMVTQVAHGTTLHKEAFEYFRSGGVPHLTNHLNSFVSFVRSYSKGETPYSENKYSVPGKQIQRIADEIMEKYYEQS